MLRLEWRGSGPRNLFHDDSIGVVGGTGGAAYCPREAVRRDQMATFLANVLQRVVEDGRAEPPS
jgi:hypothetical protein